MKQTNFTIFSLVLHFDIRNNVLNRGKFYGFTRTLMCSGAHVCYVSGRSLRSPVPSTQTSHTGTPSKDVVS